MAVREDSSIGKDTEVLQPPDPWLTVVRGAVMKGLSMINPVIYDVPMVKARAGRKHYGYKIGKVWDEDKHQSLRSRRFYDGLRGLWRVSVMYWIIRKVFTFVTLLPDTYLGRLES